MRRALGVYPQSAMMNHACTPNVSLRFQGASLTVRAIAAIPAGQPLRHCYGPQVPACPSDLSQ